jgi:hypothetical protein
MRRGYVAFSALALIGLVLTGCGGFHYEQREPWRAQAEQACIAQKLVQPTAYMSRMSAIEGPGSCGIDYPFKVAAFADGTVGLSQRVTLACPIIPTIDSWLNEIVQPAASTYFGSSVVEVKAGTYSCRPRNNQRGARVSEHAYGNAIDVMAFRFADGRELTVVKGWRGAEEEQDFLREVFVGACNYFNTVLGPGSDSFHYNHFHLDLARHDPRGERHVCKPVIKFTPRIGAEEAAQSQAPPRGRWQPTEQEPIDTESDDDPFAAGPTSARQPSSTYASARPPAAPQAYSAAPVATPSIRSGAMPDEGSRRALAALAQRSSDAPATFDLPAPASSAAQAVYNRPPTASQVPAPRPPAPAPAYASPPQPVPPAREPMLLQPQLWSGQGIY